MMNVATTHLYVAEGPDVVRDGGDEQPHREKGDEEADGRKKETAVRAIRYLLMDEVAEFGEVEQQKQDGRDDHGEDQQNPRTGYVHGSGLCGDGGREAMVDSEGVRR